MIEDGLFLALGFCVAVVLAIALLPLLWARALRLTRQRLELLVPWSADEIDAERDGLRAQAAVEHRRLEQQSERSRAVLAARDIELGHRTVELVEGEMARDALQAERAALVGELADRSRALRDAEGQRFATEKALHDADRHIETDAAAAREQAARYDGLFALSEQRRGAIAALETRVAGLLAKVEDRDDALVTLEASLKDERAQGTRLLARHEDLTATHATLARAHDALQEMLADHEAKAAVREERLRGRTEALAAAETRINEQDVAMSEKDARLAALQARFDGLMAELAARNEAADPPAAEDVRLRAAIVAAGDETLRLLASDGDDTAGDAAPRRSQGHA